MFLQQAENFFDWRIALAKREVLTLIALAILYMERHDAIMVFVQEIDDVKVGGGEMPDVQIDGDILGNSLHGLAEVIRRGELISADSGVVVHANSDFGPPGERIDALGCAHIAGGCKVSYAERLGHLKTAGDLFVGKVIAKAQVVGVKLNAGAIEFVTHFPELVQRHGQPPLTKRFAALPARFDVALVEFTTAQADLDHPLNGIVQGPVPKAVALHSDLNTVEL